MNPPIAWLLEGAPWIVYGTRRDLLGESEKNAAVRDARASIAADPRVGALLKELAEWPGTVIASHKSAGQSFHKLTFLADLGLRAGDPGMDRIIARIFEHRSEEGLFELPMNIPSHYGGTGKDEWAWALCDAPLIVYALAKFGLAKDRKVRAAAEYLAGLVRDNGWPCAVSKKLGKFRGPGRKEDPCPFATLAVLKMLSEFPDLGDGAACRKGAESLLALWSKSRTEHPYIFYMGTDFRKLKVPFVWYDLMHVLEVLTRFPWLKKDKRLLDMAKILKAKAGGDGRFTPESVWAAWKDWEFGRKKEPSRWLTLAAWRILGRLGAV